MNGGSAECYRSFFMTAGSFLMAEKQAKVALIAVRLAFHIGQPGPGSEVDGSCGRRERR